MIMLISHDGNTLSPAKSENTVSKIHQSESFVDHALLSQLVICRVRREMVVSAGSVSDLILDMHLP